MTDEMLMQAAEAARKNAYAPYSGFTVGAALLTTGGKVYTGCNIENAAFSPTNCAERTAVFKAISEGACQFLAIAVTGGKQGAQGQVNCTPCGVCRQVLAEFCRPDLRVLLGHPGAITCHTLGGLLPQAFLPGAVKE